MESVILYPAAQDIHKHLYVSFGSSETKQCALGVYPSRSINPGWL